MATICFVAREHFTTGGRSFWNVCEEEDNNTWPIGIDSRLRRYRLVSKGHSLESAMEMVARLNDDLKAVREVIANDQA